MAMGVQPITVTDNTYMIWQTIVAVMTAITISVGWLTYLYKRLKAAAAERKEANSNENAKILAAVEALTVRVEKLEPK